MNFTGQGNRTPVPATAGKAERISARRSHQIRRLFASWGNCWEAAHGWPRKHPFNRFLGPQPKENHLLRLASTQRLCQLLENSTHSLIDFSPGGQQFSCSNFWAAPWNHRMLCPQLTADKMPKDDKRRDRYRTDDFPAREKAGRQSGELTNTLVLLTI